MVGVRAQRKRGDARVRRIDRIRHIVDPLDGSDKEAEGPGNPGVSQPSMRGRLGAG